MSPSSKDNKDKPTNDFNILPHPAKSNDPADLQPQPSTGEGGLQSGSRGAAEAFHARDPYVPSEEIRNSLPPPLSREELKAKQANLASLNDEK